MRKQWVPGPSFFLLRGKGEATPFHAPLWVTDHLHGLLLSMHLGAWMFHLETQRVCSFILGALGHHNNEKTLTWSAPFHASTYWVGTTELHAPPLDTTVKTLTLSMHVYVYIRSLCLCFCIPMQPTLDKYWIHTLSGRILPLTSALAGDISMYPSVCTCRMF